MENTQDYQDYQDYRAEILGIVRSNASPGIMRNKLEDYHENDLADVFPDLSVAERRKLCRILNLDMLADIFEYIDEKQAAEYLDEMDVRKAAAILSRMETDAVVDVLRMIPKEKRALLLELMDDEARKDMAVIAAFDDEEIGSRMTTNYIEIRENLTVKQAMTELVSQAAKNDNISTIFMVTADHTFYGAMDLKDLITARQDTRLEDLIVTSYPYVYGHELIDDCIEKLKDYSENSIPILDNDNKLLGVITSQSIVDLVDDEMGEDYAMFAGLTADKGTIRDKGRHGNHIPHHRDKAAIAGHSQSKTSPEELTHSHDFLHRCITVNVASTRIHARTPITQGAPALREIKYSKRYVSRKPIVFINISEDFITIDCVIDCYRTE